MKYSIARFSLSDYSRPVESAEDWINQMADDGWTLHTFTYTTIGDHCVVVMSKANKGFATGYDK